jgi:hypothetical protein
MQDLIGAVGQDANVETKPPDCLYQASGLRDQVVCGLLGFQGQNYLMQWVCHDRELSSEAHLATKKALRIALHLIRQDREKADPTRSTMQKLNRFLYE